MTKFNFLKKSAYLGTAFALSTTALLQNPTTYAAPSPITVAVIKVKDNSNAPWFKPSYEDKLRTILSTELASAGHFTVLERDASTLKELKQEVKDLIWKEWVWTHAKFPALRSPALRFVFLPAAASTALALLSATATATRRLEEDFRDQAHRRAEKPRRTPRPAQPCR